jgi:hypothetical protein
MSEPAEKRENEVLQAMVRPAVARPRTVVNWRGGQRDEQDEQDAKRLHAKLEDSAQRLHALPVERGMGQQPCCTSASQRIMHMRIKAISAMTAE